MKVDNYTAISSLLNFELGTYHVQIIARSKDGHSPSRAILGEWFISSQDKLDLLQPGFMTLCAMYNARCYIGINPKSSTHVAWRMMHNITSRLENDSVGNITNILSSAHDKCTGNTVKYWVVDVDPEFDLATVREIVTRSKSSKSCPGNIYLELPTVNGYHLITQPFDLRELKAVYPKLQIGKNNMTLLFA